jgi:hypothetical protein
MEKLDTALDDLIGLLEAHRAAGDDARPSSLRRSRDTLKTLRRELGAAADAYAAVVMASSGGSVTPERLKRARDEARAALESAWGKRKELARMVEHARLPMNEERDDLRALLSLSLQCRAAIAAFDAVASDAGTNKVLVELRAATLAYQSRLRESDGDVAAARKAAAQVLDKARPHAEALARLQPAAAEPGGIEQTMVAEGVSGPLGALVRAWTAESPSPETAPETTATETPSADADAADDRFEDASSEDEPQAEVEFAAMPADDGPDDGIEVDDARGEIDVPASDDDERSEDAA